MIWTRRVTRLPPGVRQDLAHDLDAAGDQAVLRHVYAGGLTVRASQVAYDAAGERIVVNRQEQYRRRELGKLQRARRRLAADRDHQIAVLTRQVLCLLAILLEARFGEAIKEQGASAFRITDLRESLHHRRCVQRRLQGTRTENTDPDPARLCARPGCDRRQRTEREKPTAADQLLTAIPAGQVTPVPPSPQ
jgi:hypothetical protein